MRAGQGEWGGPGMNRRGMIALVAAALSLLSTLLLAACGGGGAPSGPTATPAGPVEGVVSVRAFEWGYEPEAIVLRAGEEVTIELLNDGSLLHNLKVEDGLDAEDVESVSTGGLSADEGELFVGAEKGGEGTLSFVPRGAGTFAIYCTIRGHRQLGMEGVLSVE